MNVPKTPWFAVQVSYDRKVRLFEYELGSDVGTAHTPWTDAPSMRPITEPNLLRVEVVDKKVRIFVNHVHVVDAHHPEPKARALNLNVFANNNARVDARFRRVRVWRLPAPDTADEK